MPLVDLREQAVRRTPEQQVAHLRAFELNLRFSAGIWYFSPPASRFHEKYQADVEIERRLEVAAQLVPYGLGALEAHYPNEINEGNVEPWKRVCQQAGLRILTVIPLLFWDREFEWGSLSNPRAEIRKRAIERTRATLALNRQLDTDFAVVWPGIDGFENSFGMDFVAARDRFIDGLAEALDGVPGVRIAFEPKPYEPRGRILFGSTAEGLLLCQRVEKRLHAAENRRLIDGGTPLACMNPEIGHVLMGFEDLAYAFSLPLEEGRLAHTHCNSQPLGNYDQDLNVGVVSPEQTEAWLYTLKMYGYRGYFGIDVLPERMPVEMAVRNSIDALRAANDRINAVDHEAIVFAQNHPDRARGWLEGHLIRMRARFPERLPPLARPM